MSFELQCRSGNRFLVQYEEMVSVRRSCLFELNKKRSTCLARFLIYGRMSPAAIGGWLGRVVSSTNESLRSLTLHAPAPHAPQQSTGFVSQRTINTHRPTLNTVKANYF